MASWNLSRLGTGRLWSGRSSTRACSWASIVTIPKSDFRDTLAQYNTPLFTGFGARPVPADASVLAVLLHSQSHHDDYDERQKYGYLAGSAYVAFPASDVPGYLHTVNLFERYSDVVLQHLPNEWDGEAQVRFLRRARRTA